MDRKAHVAKRPQTTRRIHSTRAQSRRGKNVSPLPPVDVQSARTSRERGFERREVIEARNSLIELFDLLEEYAPMWYTAAHHERALAAIRALKES